MIESIDKRTKAIDENKCVDIVYFDIAKAFDTINNVQKT